MEELDCVCFIENKMALYFYIILCFYLRTQVTRPAVQNTRIIINFNIINIIIDIVRLDLQLITHFTCTSGLSTTSRHFTRSW